MIHLTINDKGYFKKPIQAHIDTIQDVRFAIEQIEDFENKKFFLDIQSHVCNETFKRITTSKLYELLKL